MRTIPILSFLFSMIFPVSNFQFISPDLSFSGEANGAFQRSRRDSLKVGDEAPPFALRDLATDEPTFLRDYTGKTLRDGKTERHALVMSFWATWCQPCKVEIPLLMKMAQDFKGQPVKIFLVNTKEEKSVTEDSVRAVYKTRNYTLPCLVDPTWRAADNFKVNGLPMIVVIDKFGIVRKINRGFHENFHIDIANLLRTLVQEDSTSRKP